MRVFVNYADNFLGRALCKKLRLLKHTIVGTHKAKTVTNTQANHSLHEVIQASNKTELRKAIDSCEVIIYNILELSQAQEAEWVMQEISARPNSVTKTFICLSPSLTWAKTKWDKEDEEAAPLSEQDVKKRKPHPDYTKHLELEKYFLKQNTDEFKALVINYGLLYGEEEEDLHPLFKALWHGTITSPPIIAEGTNFVPTIHVTDLANITAFLITAEVDDHYYLAIDGANSSLKDLMEALGKEMGNKGEEGKSLSVTRDSKEINELFPTLSTVETLLLDIKLKSNLLLEMEGLEWHCKEGFIEKIGQVVQEFRTTRKLTPLKIIVHGPPASGKSLFSQKLSAHYEVPHIKIKDTITMILGKDTELAEQVKEALANLANEEEAPAEDAPEDEDENAESADANKADADAIDPDAPPKAAAAPPEPRIPDEFLVKIVRKRLQHRDCRNQGYVLDGFPKTLSQTTALFGGGEANDDEEQEQPDPHVFPEYMIDLEAPEEELKKRLMALPESQVTGTHNTEEGFKRRYAAFQRENPEDQPIVSYFDEKDVLVLSVDTCEDVDATFTNLTRTIGAPHNYGPTPAKIAEAKRKAEEAAAVEKQKQEQEQQEKEQQEVVGRSQRESVVNQRRKEIEEDEKKVQQVLSMPLRQYLMDKVMPVLTEALLDVCKTRPPDAIDYLVRMISAPFNELK
eukprot:TRINITY_DN1076_c0_g1_i1.p1 TRINITY_DN1076_c0_g1~~TRINITY_DN1076_c0_g1_i1.p1  ORF type:complete len:685 (-),score=196.94 TRINITY_DN1076_c0_g1_i1:550-2604(-)